MKNKTVNSKLSKTLLSAVLTIAIALSMIAGATYALFTSTAGVNVAVTSATVKVTAAPSNIELYSPQLINLDGTIADATDIAVDTFAGGGTAAFAGNTLTISKIAPGDKVSFDMVYSNQSNIKVKYRLKIEGIGQTIDGSTQTNDELLSALTTTIEETGKDPVVYEKLKTYVSAWQELEPVETAVGSLKVTIELPADKGNTYQNLECSYRYSIEAVQANTKTEDYVEQFGGTQGDAYVEQLAYDYNEVEPKNALTAVSAGQGSTIILGYDITTPDMYAITETFDGVALTIGTERRLM